MKGQASTCPVGESGVAALHPFPLRDLHGGRSLAAAIVTFLHPHGKLLVSAVGSNVVDLFNLASEGRVGPLNPEVSSGASGRDAGNDHRSEDGAGSVCPACENCSP